MGGTEQLHVLISVSEVSATVHGVGMWVQAMPMAAMGMYTSSSLQRKKVCVGGCGGHMSCVQAAAVRGCRLWFPCCQAMLCAVQSALWQFMAVQDAMAACNKSAF